jgi:hypothetical protein
MTSYLLRSNAYRKRATTFAGRSLADKLRSHLATLLLSACLTFKCRLDKYANCLLPCLFPSADRLYIRQSGLCQHWELVWPSVSCLVPHEVNLSAKINWAKRLTQLTGNLWYMYAAWWMFLIGLTVTAGLGMAGSGNDDYNKRPSQAEWTARRWTLLGIVGCTLCVVGGFVSFCWSMLKYSLAHPC